MSYNHQYPAQQDIPNNPMLQPTQGHSQNNFQQPPQYQYDDNNNNYGQQAGGVIQPPPQIPDNLFNQGQNIVQPPDGQFNQVNHLPQIPGCLDPAPDLDMNQQWWQQWESQQNLSLNQNYRIFQVQKMNTVVDSTVIGVIDQSGSMGDCFHHLAKEWNAQIKAKFPTSKAVTFHNFSQLQDQLQEYPELGTTEVESGFKKLNEVLNQPGQIKDYVTIIFISDGMDNNPNTIYQRLDNLVSQIPRNKKINFITIGVGEGFPTYLAMQLRQMYHNGESNIPPVFLVYNQHVQENWKVTFGIVTKYLKHNCPVQFDQQVQQFPWQLPQYFAYEESYVYTTNMSITSLNYCGVEIKYTEKMTPQQVIDISRTLLSSAQLSNLKYGTNDNTKSEVVVSQRITEDLKKKFWGKKNKKKEEKEQLAAVQTEMKQLEEDPDLKSKQNKPSGDKHLALKLAVGAVGAGVGLYWLVGNYGEFMNIMGGLNFAGLADCGCCGSICGGCGGLLDGCDCGCLGDISDKICGLCNCESCGDCFSTIFKSGQGCLGDVCKFLCEILNHAANSICGLLG